MMDIFDQKHLSPMLLSETVPFDSSDYIFELKLDGIRCLAFLNSCETVLRNKRNKDVSNTYPELSEMHNSVRKKCILDGELVYMESGKVDFFELQRRSLMTDRLKILLAAQRHPINFVAYDILYLDDKQITELPLMERKALLLQNVVENNRLSVSRYIEERGVDFFKLAKQQDLEGVVAKRKDSQYFFGTRSKHWLKIKVMQEEDLIICGYVPTDGGNVKDLVLGYYDQNMKLCERGRVYFGMSRATNGEILRFAKSNPSDKPFGFKNDDKVIWIQPLLVGTVKYMMETKSGGMRQPVFKGLREDKEAKDCILDEKKG